MSRMNANLILGTQYPNIGNTLAQTTRAAMLANQNDHIQRGNVLYQEHGPGIMSGDPEAMAAYAQYDAPAAAGLAQNRRQEGRLDEQLDMRRKEFDLKLEAWAKQASDEEREREAMKMQRTVIGAISYYQNGDLDGVNKHFAANGSPTIESLDQFPAYAALAGDAFNTLVKIDELMSGPGPQSGPGKVQADINQGLLPADTPLRGQGTTVNVGNIEKSAEAGVVDPNAIEPSGKIDGNVADAVGVTGFAVGVANSIGEAFRLGQPGPEVDKAQTALTSLATKTMLGLSEGFPGRPSNLTRERIEDLTIRPGSVWTGPERALNKTRDMIETLDDSIRAANAVLLDPIYTRADKAKAKTALRQLTTLFADYRALEQALANPQTQQGNTTKSGVTWEVIE